MKPFKYPFWISNKPLLVQSGVWVLHEGLQQELLLGAEEPDRIAHTNAISIQIRKLIYRGKCAYFSSHPSPLLTRIISRISVRVSPPTRPKQYSICPRTSAAPLCPLPSLVTQLDPVFASMYGRDFIQWGCDFFPLLCYTTSGAKPQRQELTGTSACELY